MVKVTDKCRIKMSNMGFTRCIINWACDKPFITFGVYQTLISRNQKPNIRNSSFEFRPIPKYHSENKIYFWCILIKKQYFSVKHYTRSLIKACWSCVLATVICLSQCRIVWIKIIMISITFPVQLFSPRWQSTLDLYGINYTKQKLNWTFVRKKYYGLYLAHDPVHMHFYRFDLSLYYTTSRMLMRCNQFLVWMALEHYLGFWIGTRW